MFNQTGWICPNCGMGCSPTLPYCCKPSQINIATDNANIKFQLCPHGFTIKSNCYECSNVDGYRLNTSK